MSSKDSSRRDIAKQFELPERKSKIATLLKESDVYCICRSTDSTRFMIACDNCEEWYHGDCINITEPESRNIKQYFCPPCKLQNASLKIEYKKPKGSSVVLKEKSPKKHNERKPGRPKKSSADYPVSVREDDPSKTAGCGSCTGCLTVVDCGRCDRCKKNQKYDGKSRRQCRKRECVDQSENEEQPEIKQESVQVLTERQVEATDEEDDWQPLPIKPRKQKLTPSKKGRKQRVSKESAKDKLSRRKVKARQLSYSGSSGNEVSDAIEENIQCYGLDCVNPAKKGSKYCSDDCGVKLATERLFRVLPGRIQEWNLTPCTAEEHNKRDLEDIRRKQLETRTALTDLEKKRSELDHHVQFVQQLKVDSDLEDDEPDEDGIIHCITCGHEIAIKSCLKHMERCYNKYESQTSFGSIYKTKLEGTPIFCDVFNPLNGTYCKRLKVLCPEHTKEPKIRDSEVCGCPLIKDLFQASKEICRLSKKKCNKHFCWEKLRRAEIDMERVRHWLKLDELLEQERQLRSAMTNRAGVMGLLLHSTFDHELRSRIQHQIQEGNLQKEQREQTQVQSKQKNSAPATSKSIRYFEPTQDDIVGEPLVKKRDKDRRRSSPTDLLKNDQKEEVTASKLYKRMLSNSHD